MTKGLRGLMLTVLVTIAVWFLPTAAHAQSLDYSALKYGTNQTSMASGYFVHPAKVTVKNHAYVVTMDIKTAKKLTSWPVKVLSVDGQSPENVRKVKDSAGNSHLYYSFTTTNLKRAVNAKLSIYVPDVYKAKHLITFKFKTGNLPALNQRTTTTRAKRTQSSTATSASTKPAVTAASSSAKSASKAQAKSSATKAKNKAKSSSKAKSSQSTSSQSSSSTDSQSASSADQLPAHQTHWGALIGGVVAIVVLVGGGSWWYFGRH
ncbi:NEAT domain-containing protein [Levilactobacillus mulengensis]|uniref:NEAT domain-containing protein n=1 Tax=Levilactobacillus mulengensis TaxID=2486025 RepID=UPI000F7B5B6E|nr:NEAT domain-containing protein [Levilactobacillus mulengensis]